MLITGLMLAAVGCSSVEPEQAPVPEVQQQATVVENPSSKEMTSVPAPTTSETVEGVKGQVPTTTVPSTQMEMPSTEVLEKAKDKVPVKKIM
ncbi:MAG: hypothetical protein ACRCWN_02700 [Fusobacteriaceae bacterium]